MSIYGKIRRVTADVPLAVIYSAKIVNGVTPGIVTAPIGVAIGTAISGDMADIGTHCFMIEGLIEGVATTGNLVIQAAQKVSDLGALTIKRGAFIIVWPE